MTPLRHIYRAAIRRAGIFEAPPAMVKSISEWLYSVAASHVLAEVQTKLAQADDPSKPIKDAITAIDEFLATIEAKAKGLKKGQYLRFGMPPVVGFRPLVVGVKYLDVPYMEPRYQIGKGVASLTFRDVLPLNIVIGEAKEILDRRRNALDRQLKAVDRIERMTDIQFLNLKMLQKECQKYTTTAKRYTSKASREFPVDLTGWKYLRPDAPVIRAYNDAVSKNNQVLEEGIKKAEAELVLAQKIYDTEIKGKTISRADAKKMVDADHWNYWRVDNAVRNEERPDEAWGKFNLISLGWLSTSEDKMTVEDARKQIKPILGPDDAAKAVSVMWRSKINVRLLFTRTGHNGYVGQWSSSANELQVVMGGLNYFPKAVASFQEAIEALGGIVRHEVQHVGQEALKVMVQMKGKEEGGLPSRSLREEKVTPQGLPSVLNSLSPKKVEHALRDVEFYTDLADAIGQFKLLAKSYRDEDLPIIFRQFVGMRGKETPSEGNLTVRRLTEPSRLDVSMNRHFQTWLGKARDKWRKAVAEAAKSLLADGYPIYGKGKIMARQGR